MLRRILELDHLLATDNKDPTSGGRKSNDRSWHEVAVVNWDCVLVEGNALVGKCVGHLRNMGK